MRRSKRLFFSIAGITLITVLTIALIFLLTYKNHETCTIFTVSKGSDVYFGNNEDWHTDDLIIGFFPSTATQYGSVHFGYQDSAGTAQFQGAVNVMGLSWDVNSLPKTESNAHPEKLYDRFEDNVLTKITKEAATVADAVAILEQTDFGSTMTYQIHIADATGDAVIVSNGPEGEIAYTRMDPGIGYLVSTNFNHAIEGNGEQGWRYDTAVSMLAAMEAEDISGEALGQVLSAVHLNMLTTFTMYSDVIDLSNQTLYLYYMSQYNECAVINIPEELLKGQRIVPMSTFFSQETVDSGDRAYRRFEIRFMAAIVAVLLLGTAVIVFVIIVIIRIVKRKKRNKALH